jgi:hypothetical protein
MNRNTMMNFRQLSRGPLSIKLKIHHLLILFSPFYLQNIYFSRPLLQLIDNHIFIKIKAHHLPTNGKKILTTF